MVRALIEAVEERAVITGPLLVLVARAQLQGECFDALAIYVPFARDRIQSV